MTILITVAITIIILLLFLVWSVNTANYIQMQKQSNLITELLTHSRTTQNQINNLQKYVMELSIVIDNLGAISQELQQAIYENSFKIVRDGPRMFTGFSADEIAEKMKKENYELTDEDVNQLRDLFMNLDEDDEDDEETF